MARPTFFLIAALLLMVPGLAEPPRRAMVLVFDQMRPEYIDRYDLKNFKRARAMGVDFRNGIVGDLESNTIVSHPVITTGKLPNHLPWGTQVMKDTEGLLGERGAFYNPFGLTVEQWMELHRKTSGDTSLIARVKGSNPGPAFAVAQKRYAAFNFGGPYADTIVTLGPAITEGPFKGRHRPEGRNIPKSIAEPEGGRFYLDAREDWGSHGEIYPFHGAAFTTGDDPHHLGGDVWVGDAVEIFMAESPDWSVILASFGTIDKVSHVLGEHDRPTDKEWARKNHLTLAEAAAKADVELGRILDRLEASGQLQETAIVITADHGGQRNEHFHGRIAPNAHLDNLYYGLGHTTNVPPAVRPLIDTGLVQAASMNTSVMFWTRPMTSQQQATFAGLLEKTPGVAEVYLKGPDGRYFRRWRSPELRGRELAWAELKHALLVDTLSGAAGPEFVGLLFDKHGYDVPGSHGGAQELVQRIPFLVIAPDLPKGVVDEAWVRLVDINPILGRLMGLPPHSGLDGSSEALDELP